MRVNTLILESTLRLVQFLLVSEAVEVGNMTAMVNISQNKEPKVPKGIKHNLEQMGLYSYSKATLQDGLTSQANNVDAYNEATSDKNMWYIALTTELLSTICQEGKVAPTNIPGSLMMPNWDKVVFSPTPTAALMNLFFHATAACADSTSVNSLHAVL